MDGSYDNRTFTRVTQMYLTLLRKNRDEVSITTADGENYVGTIDAFDPAGIIFFETKPDGQIYISRTQIVAIIPTKAVSYIKFYAENEPEKGR